MVFVIVTSNFLILAFMVRQKNITCGHVKAYKHLPRPHATSFCHINISKKWKKTIIIIKKEIKKNIRIKKKKLKPRMREMVWGSHQPIGGRTPNGKDGGTHLRAWDQPHRWIEWGPTYELRVDRVVRFHLALTHPWGGIFPKSGWSLGENSPRGLSWGGFHHFPVARSNPRERSPTSGWQVVAHYLIRLGFSFYLFLFYFFNFFFIFFLFLSNNDVAKLLVMGGTLQTLTGIDVIDR